MISALHHLHTVVVKSLSLLFSHLLFSLLSLSLFHSYLATQPKKTLKNYGNITDPFLNPLFTSKYYLTLIPQLTYVLHPSHRLFKPLTNYFSTAKFYNTLYSSSLYILSYEFSKFINVTYSFFFSSLCITLCSSTTLSRSLSYLLIKLLPHKFEGIPSILHPL